MRRVARTLAASLIVAIMLGVAGCFALAPPDAYPDISGTISGLTRQDSTMSFLVVGTGSYDQARVSTTDETVILHRDGDSYTETDTVADGDTVQVWFTGPVAESYPVQATAGTLVVE